MLATCNLQPWIFFDLKTAPYWLPMRDIPSEKTRKQLHGYDFMYKHKVFQVSIRLHYFFIGMFFFSAYFFKILEALILSRNPVFQVEITVAT